MTHAKSMITLNHAFPQDFRSGRDWNDWDPFKWAIFFLYKVGLVKSLKRAPDEDVEFAMDYMRRKKGGVHHDGEPYSVDKQEKEFGEWTGPVWSRIKAEEHVKQACGKCFVFVNDYLVDVTAFMKEHAQRSFAPTPFGARARISTLVKSLKRAPDSDVEFAMDYMRRKKGGVHHDGEPYSVDKQEKEFGEWTGPVWSRIKAEEHVKQARGKCFVFVNDYLVDVTVFMKEHVGGAKILRTYSIRGEGGFQLPRRHLGLPEL
ncbi:hypothetical protein BU17DRAFT_81767 [Hysterangium stoloniferum]|nr:hypothetical protein BU17DRAFT_81767 [Hysterangium stoloniferum]